MTKFLSEKKAFQRDLKSFVQSFASYVSIDDGQWTIKGFIDTYKNSYTILSDIKVVSKILEIHFLPKKTNFFPKPTTTPSLGRRIRMKFYCICTAFSCAPSDQPHNHLCSDATRKIFISVK